MKDGARTIFRRVRQVCGWKMCRHSGAVSDPLTSYAILVGEGIGHDETSDGMKGVARTLRRPFARRGQFEWIKAGAAVFVFARLAFREQ